MGCAIAERGEVERDPLQCILPPYMVEEMAQSGSERIRSRALNNQSVSATVRFARGNLDTFFRGTAAKSFLQEMFLDSGPTKVRTIYSADNANRIPGRIVRSEGSAPTGDPAVDEAYDGLGSTLDLYWEIYGRNSLNGRGLPLNATVHFREDYDNAFWDGRQMIFGNGDGELFNRFTIAVDVIAHELTHGVTQFESGMFYWSQAGSLNEHLSDVFGSLVKQYVLKQTADQADWLIGAGLLAPNVNGVALRSLQAPGTAYDDLELGQDPQPAHMRDFVQTLSDNRGVHINSGIPNHAFYLAASEIGGPAWEGAGQIWYRTMTSALLGRWETFDSFARKTLIAARFLFGTASREHRAVRTAWAAVGIDI